MTEKKDFYRMIRFLGIGMLLVMAFIFCVDPFYHYHDAWFGMPRILDDAVYQTAGAAKHFEYDSVILGTSMTENFHASWFDEQLGWNTVKLSYSGARTDDLKAILEEVFSGKIPPRNIVMDLNVYQLMELSWTAYAERPGYLYDNNPFNDVYYFYNIDVLTLAAERVADAAGGRQSNLDEAYTWESEDLFNREKLLQDHYRVRALIQPEEEKTEEEIIKNCQENLDNIIPFIESHPESTFYIFYPPYSVLYWEQRMLSGQLDSILCAITHSMEQLMVYENVQLYYFQDEFDLISNLDCYRDGCHHKPEYNYYISQCISENRNRLDETNYKNRLEAFRKYILEYDFDGMWEEYLRDKQD